MIDTRPPVHCPITGTSSVAPVLWHQFCGAHLLRDIPAMIERGGSSEAISHRLKESGQELIHHWNRLRDEQIVRTTFHTRHRRVRNNIRDALDEGAACAEDRTAKTCRRLSNHCDSLFVFAHAQGVSPTNSAAERSLRRGVIFCKLSFGTESSSGRETLAVTMSVLETCRRLGQHALSGITEAVTQPNPTTPST